MGAMRAPVLSKRWRSARCVATRWSTLSCRICAPVSSTARESPRLAIVSSHPHCNGRPDTVAGKAMMAGHPQALAERRAPYVILVMCYCAITHILHRPFSAFSCLKPQEAPVMGCTKAEEGRIWTDLDDDGDSGP